MPDAAPTGGLTDQVEDTPGPVRVAAEDAPPDPLRGEGEDAAPEPVPAPPPEPRGTDDLRPVEDGPSAAQQGAPTAPAVGAPEGPEAAPGAAPTATGAPGSGTPTPGGDADAAPTVVLPVAVDRSPHRAEHRRADPAPVPRRRRTLVRVALAVLGLLLAVATVAVVHLWRTSDAWETRAATYEGEAEGLGIELATTRAELEGARSELAAVRDQLSTANTRIAELANEKAQIGDDREAQRQLADYQERVTEAAGGVALALDQCVQGQQQLITYLRAQADAPPDQRPYDEAALTQYAADVDALCQTATEANATLQTELER